MAILRSRGTESAVIRRRRPAETQLQPDAGSQGGPKRKKVSKRGTKNMRKNTDIADVEDFLEEKRRDERVMGEAASDMKDDALFFVDKNALPTAHGEDVVEDLFGGDDNTTSTGQGMTRKEMRKLALTKPTYVDRVLEGKSKIKPVYGKKPSAKKKNPAPSLKKHQKSDGKAPGEHGKKKEEEEETEYALWEDGKQGAKTDSMTEKKKKNGKTTDEMKENGFLEATEKKTVRMSKRLLNVKEKEMKAEWNAKAVPAPIKGQSYNPTLADHQDLMRTAADIEVKKIEKIEYYKEKMAVPASLVDLKSEIEQRTVEIMASEGIRGKKAMKRYEMQMQQRMRKGNGASGDADGDDFLGVHDTSDMSSAARGSSNTVSGFSVLPLASGGSAPRVTGDVLELGNGKVTTKQERVKQQKKLAAKREKMRQAQAERDEKDAQKEEENEGSDEQNEEEAEDEEEDKEVCEKMGGHRGGSGIVSCGETNDESSGDSDSEDEMEAEDSSKPLHRAGPKTKKDKLEMLIKRNTEPASTRKTKAQRNKEARAKIEEEERMASKLLKMRMNEVYRLKGLKKTIENEQKIQEAERLEKEAREAYKRANFPKRLGKVKYVPENIEVKIPEEMCSSLRELVPEGNMFADRFKTFQRRNLIEPRVPAKVTRRYARKEYVKHSHKDCKTKQ
eukprot:Nk52_evm19s559 gene=Nk52_evmTU19s559